MKRNSETPLLSSELRVMYVTAPANRRHTAEKETQLVTENRKASESPIRMMVDWRLEHEVESTRQQIVRRARSLADRLTRLADGLEHDREYGFNTLGELQGNGVELDAWCVKLGFARQTLKEFKQALAEEDTNAG